MMAETTLKRHPGRAAAWGFLLGLAAVLYLTVVWPVIAFDNWTTVTVKAVIVILVVMALSVLWGLFGPAKKPRGAAPAALPTADGPPPPPAVDPEPAPSTNETE
jgi:hypothetical protein